MFSIGGKVHSLEIIKATLSNKEGEEGELSGIFHPKSIIISRVKTLEVISKH